ncbi:MAG: protein kinase, partial [Micromonosporaceae bacterium]|nr:protein kinase [Micromonosporaceae bacterium]
MAPRHSEDSIRAGGTGHVTRAGGAIDLPGYHDFVLVARSEGSEVYRARQDGLDRHVAVKMLLLDDPEAVARFGRELQITVRLGRQHPHIVTVIDTGTTSTGRPCIVMEYYDLGSVHDRLKTHGPLPAEQVIAVGSVVADALAFAHSHGVLHRDVKPQNILVLPTSYVVADFGIARHIGAAHTASVEWFSYRHAAPQVLDGATPAVEDDIWSVGSTLFTLLEGVSPFASDDPAEDTALPYMHRVRTSTPRPLTTPNIPPTLAAIINRCLQHQRTDRYPDATTLYNAFITLAAENRTAWAPRGSTGASVDPHRPEGRYPAGPPYANGSLAGPSSARLGSTDGATGTGPVGVPVAPRGPSAAGPPPVGSRPAGAAADPTTARGAPAEMSPVDLAHLVASAVVAGGYVPDGDTTSRPAGPGRQQPGTQRPAEKPSTPPAARFAAPRLRTGETNPPAEGGPDAGERSGGRLGALVIFGLVGILLVGALIATGTYIYRRQRSSAAASGTAPPAGTGGLALPTGTGPAFGSPVTPGAGVAPVVTAAGGNAAGGSGGVRS